MNVALGFDVSPYPEATKRNRTVATEMFPVGKVRIQTRDLEDPNPFDGLITSQSGNTDVVDYYCYFDDDLLTIRVRHYDVRFLTPVIRQIMQTLQYCGVPPAPRQSSDAKARTSETTAPVDMAYTRHPDRVRRVLYEFDAYSRIISRPSGTKPTVITVDDLKRSIDEVTFEGSRVDTVLVRNNAQVMYYPTQVGTQAGMISTPEEKSKWSKSEKQLFENLQRFYLSGVDPYAVMIAEAKQKGREALLAIGMNSSYSARDSFTRTQFWIDHPECRLGAGVRLGPGSWKNTGSTADLDFAHAKVRDYKARLIEEAVRRYDCDGIELDFGSPYFFGYSSTDERVAKMNELVKRVRGILDVVGRERGRRLVLAVQVPSHFGHSPATPEFSLKCGCDVPTWAKNGWIDFVIVADWSTRYEIPIKLWKHAIREVPVYGGIESLNDVKKKQLREADGYRRAANNLRKDGADGVYLISSFATPFDVLSDLGVKKEGD